MWIVQPSAALWGGAGLERQVVRARDLRLPVRVGHHEAVRARLVEVQRPEVVAIPEVVVGWHVARAVLRARLAARPRLAAAPVLVGDQRELAVVARLGLVGEVDRRIHQALQDDRVRGVRDVDHVRRLIAGRRVDVVLAVWPVVDDQVVRRRRAEPGLRRPVLHARQLHRCGGVRQVEDVDPVVTRHVLVDVEVRPVERVVVRADEHAVAVADGKERDLDRVLRVGEREHDAPLLARMAGVVAALDRHRRPLAVGRQLHVVLTARAVEQPDARRVLGIGDVDHRQASGARRAVAGERGTGRRRLARAGAVGADVGVVAGELDVRPEVDRHVRDDLHVLALARERMGRGQRRRLGRCLRGARRLDLRVAHVPGVSAAAGLAGDAERDRRADRAGRGDRERRDRAAPLAGALHGSLVRRRHQYVTRVGSAFTGRSTSLPRKRAVTRWRPRSRTFSSVS